MVLQAACNSLELPGSGDESRRRVFIRSRLFGLATAACLALTACGPPLEATAPLSAEPTAVADERLGGAWYIVGGGHPRGYKAPFLLLVDRNRDHGYSVGGPLEWLHVNFVFTSAQVTFSYHLRAHPSDVGGVTYYNLRRNPDLPNVDYTAPGEVPGYIIARVFFLGDDLFAVCTLGSNLETGPHPRVEDFESLGLKARVVQGQSRIGEQVYAKEDKGLDYMILDATTEQLVDLIGNDHGERLFSSFGLFARFGTVYDEQTYKSLKSQSEQTPAVKEVRRICGGDW